MRAWLGSIQVPRNGESSRHRSRLFGRGSAVEEGTSSDAHAGGGGGGGAGGGGGDGCGAALTSEGLFGLRLLLLSLTSSRVFACACVRVLAQSSIFLTK